MQWERIFYYKVMSSANRDSSACSLPIRIVLFHFIAHLPSLEPAERIWLVPDLGEVVSLSHSVMLAVAVHTRPLPGWESL